MNDGGPAFPVPAVHPFGGWTAVGGMTMRDYFAAAAIQGLLANPFIAEAMQGANASGREQHHLVVVAAFEIADRALAQREKGQQ